MISPFWVGVLWGAGYYVVGILIETYIEQKERVGGGGPLAELLVKTLWPIIFTLWAVGVIYRALEPFLSFIKTFKKHHR